MAIDPAAPTQSGSIGGEASARASRFYLGPLVVLTSLFFMWGFLTCLNDILVPHLKAMFTLNYTKVMFIQFAFFAAYLLMSLPSSFVVNRFGYKGGIILGLLTSALGAALFYPAAGMHSYPMFLAALFILASGIVVLQVAANPFVAALGSPATASARLTMAQAFNSLAHATAPVFGAYLILGNAVKTPAELQGLTTAALGAYRATEAASVQIPYVGLAIALVVLALAMAISRLPKLNPASSGEASILSTGEGASAWSHRHLMLGAVAIFVYVGAEVAIGSFLVNYFKEPSIGGLTEQAAAAYLSWYWGLAMVGRFLGTVTLRLWKPDKVLVVHALMASVGVFITIATTGKLAMGSVIAVGLFNSIMFPTIFALSIDRLGRHTGQGSGILCMAIVGGAVIPVLQGVLADGIGIHHSFILAALCYLYIAWYGLAGHRGRVQKVFER